MNLTPQQIDVYKNNATKAGLTPDQINQGIMNKEQSLSGNAPVDIQGLTPYLNSTAGTAAPDARSNALSSLSNNSDVSVQGANTPAPASPSLAGFAGNFGRDIGNALGGLVNLPGNLMSNPGQTLGNMGSGLVNEYNDLLGRPLQNGKLIDVQEALKHLYEHPGNTALDILPIKGALAGKGAATAGEAGAVADTSAEAAANAVKTGAETLKPGAPMSVTALKQTIAREAAANPDMATTTAPAVPSKYIPATAAEAEAGASGTRLVRTPQGELVPQIKADLTSTSPTAVTPELQKPFTPQPVAEPATATPSVTPAGTTPLPDMNPVAAKVSAAADKVSETIGGSGSKEFIKNQLSSDNPANLGELRNRFSIPGNGPESIKPTAEALTSTGQKLGNVYKLSNWETTTSSLAGKAENFITKVTGGNPDAQAAIDYVRNSIEGGGEAKLSAAGVWDMAKTFEQSTEPAVAQVGRLLRGILKDNVKGVTNLASDYSGLKDIFDGLPDSRGIPLTGGFGNLVSGAVGGVENLVGKGTNAASSFARNFRGTPPEVAAATEDALPSIVKPGIVDRIVNPVQKANIPSLNTLKTIGSQVAKPFGSQLGQAARFGEIGAATTPQDVKAAIAPDSVTPVELTDPRTVPNPMGLKYTADELQNDLVQHPALRTTYEAIYNAGVQEAKSRIAAAALTPTDKEFVQNQAKTINDLLNTAKQALAQTSTGPQNLVVGGLRSLMDPNYSSLEGTLSNLRGLNDKMLVGGRLSGYLVTMFKNVPSTTETSAVILKKLNLMQDQLVTKYNDLLPAYAANASGSSASTLLPTITVNQQ